MSNIKSENNIELRSNEVREVLGSPPSWIIRRSILIILLIVIVLLIGSYYYKYPDIIEGRVTIISENPPIPIVAKSSGRLEILSVSDGSQVSAGQVVGVIENSANYDDMLRLKLVLDNLKHALVSLQEVTQESLPDLSNLGQCQSFYAALMSQWNECNSFVRFDYIGQQQESLSEQIISYLKYETQLKDQCIIQKRDLELSRKQFDRDSILFTQQVMSEVQYEQSEATFLKQQYSYKTALANLSNTQIQIGQLQRNKIELQIQKGEQEKSLLYLLKEKYDNLSAQYATWRQTFVLTTAIDGTIAFTELWSEKQPVQTGNVVLVVVPTINQTVYGRMVLPITGAGKLEIGQRVNIKLDNYPYMEYGFIRSTIKSISLVPITNAEISYYNAEVKLENGLFTSYNKELLFAQEMQGTAEVVTKDRRLVERFIEPVVAILSKNAE